MDELRLSIIEFFNDLTFNEELHKYFVNGVALEGSVSQIVSGFSEPFDEYNISKGSAKKFGKTQEEILNEWKEKRDESLIKGNMAHNYAENLFYDNTIEPQCDIEASVFRFYKEIPDYIVPIIPELRMYHKKYLFPGTGDLLVKNLNDDTYIILDYKTNADLYKNFKGKTLLSPFNGILDCPLNKYKIQLSLYQLLIEQISNIKVSKRYIVWLRNQGSYELIETESYCNELLKYFEK